MVRADASQAGIRALDRRCSRDSGGDGAEAENRCAGCSAYSRSTAGESVSADLDSFTGGTGSPTAIASSSQNGLPANFGTKPVAGAGPGPGRLSKKEVVAAGGRTELEGLGLDPWASRRRQELLEILDRLDPCLMELDRAVAKEAEQRPAACCLMEQPGVGPVTALMFVLTIGPVERFRRSKQVVSYLGLNPRESSSGGRQRLGAISKQGNSMARFLLVEAAQTASRYDDELRRDYQRLKFRRGTAVAKVAIARKLAVRLYWKLRKHNSLVPSTRMQGSPEHPLVGASLS